LVGELSCEFDLEVLPWLSNFNSIVSSKILEQTHALMKHTIPGLALFKIQRSIAERTPLLMKCRGTIVTVEIGPRAFSKQRPKSNPARLSFSRQPCKYR